MTARDWLRLTACMALGLVTACAMLLLPYLILLLNLAR